MSHTSYSNTSAFDVYVSATVNQFLNIETANNGSIVSTTHSISGDLKTVTWYIPRFSLAVFTFTSQFTARIRNEVYPNTQGMVCSVVVSGDSRPLSAYGFAGRSVGASSVSLPLLIKIPSFHIANTISYIPTTLGTNLAINEATTMQMNLTLVEATSDIKANIYLPLSLKMQAMEASIILGANIECVMQQQIFQDTNGDSINDSVSFHFGTCIDHYDNIDSDDDKIYITVIFVPLDVAANVNGVHPVVSATMLFGNGALVTPSSTLSDSVTYTLLEPNLSSDPVSSSRLIISDAGDIVCVISSIIVLSFIALKF